MMRVVILLDPMRPKVSLEDTIKVVNNAGLTYDPKRPDLGIVIGGDGIFSYFGRVRKIPLLFVGVRKIKPMESKGYLAEAYFDELEDVLKRIKDGGYKIVECNRLVVFLNNKKLNDFFTDVYLERGLNSNCLRYKLEVKGEGFSFTDFAISNGVAITTSAGSTGYFSSLDRIKDGSWLNIDSYTRIKDDQVGIYHILPTYTIREGTNEHPLRYVVPYGSEIRIKLAREGDARLYGITRSTKGIKIRKEDFIEVKASENKTKLIRLI
ncbi:MAG: NAD(+)/NADH kinase [archaeon]|nr:NAD(+)/NADH kinase [archaeon]